MSTANRDGEPSSVARQKHRKHHVSPEGHAKLAESGHANLRAWQLASGATSMQTIQENQAALTRVDDLMQKVVDELGGAEKLSARQSHLLESQRVALTVLALANAHFKRKGLLLRRSRPDPLLASMVSYANVVRLNLESLGLSDASEHGTDPLQTIIEEYDARKEVQR